jgi:hypothetical protein
MGEISAACFYDRCDECEVGTCTDHCHQDQTYDLIYGWVDEEENDDAA